MKELLEFLAAYPTWVKFAVVVLGAGILLLLIVFRPGPSAASTPGSAPGSSLAPAVEIVGPPTAPLGRTTYYTILSQNAVRGVWSVGGFQNEPVVVDPLGPSHQIFVEPIDPARVGNSFTIAFTAYNANGESTTARKQFLVVASDEG